MTKSENSDLIGTSQSTSQSVEVFDENSVNQDVAKKESSKPNARKALTSSQTSAFPLPVSNNTMGLENLFIGIAGLIGAGKTTLCTALGETLELPCYYEPVIENEYLEDFYRDQERYSFQLQIYLLNNRFKQQQQIIWQGKGGVQDRTIYEDCVFAKMLRDRGQMSERDYRTYVSLFSNMSNFMRKPNLIIYLDVTPEQSLERIKMRSRNMEAGIPLDYLQSLYDAYEEFIKEISHVIPVIRVNWNRFRTAEEMAEMIKQEYAQMANIRTVFDDV